jgi:hypothetical protein
VNVQKPETTPTRGKGLNNTAIFKVEFTVTGGVELFGCDFHYFHVWDYFFSAVTCYD